MNAHCQNSVLINFGNVNCTTDTKASFSMIDKPLSASPVLLATCDLANQVPDFYNVFIAYNPKDNNIYIADNRTYNYTSIWKLDIGLPSAIGCPPSIPASPTFQPTYISNNFEFDNSGNLWSFSNFNSSTGQCDMDQFDVASGTVLNSRVLQFPAGNYPNSITSGDLTILPNGRMFATLGSFPSRLYEILNYNSTTGNATATFLQTLPLSCYGVAYLNGRLELTGANFSGYCYYFEYDISTNTLSTARNFQSGQSPIDNTSFSPSIGITKQLVNAVKINANTADLTYQVYIRNIGNVVLNDVNIVENLGAVFGAGNVSNVSAAFVPGYNIGGLILNDQYNGITDTLLLKQGQTLVNQTSAITNNQCKIEVKCRVTNLNPGITYYNTAIARATINSTVSIVNIRDSSNNGNESMLDPNNNGDPTEINENIPTPYNIAPVPVRFISADATLTGSNTAWVSWLVATPTVNAARFDVEYSLNGNNWKRAGHIPIVNANTGRYGFRHDNIPTGNIYYRIRQTDDDGSYIFSRVILLHNNRRDNQFSIFPNPAGNYISISAPYSELTRSITIELYDASGRKLISQSMNASTAFVNTERLPNGTYLLKLLHDDETTVKKVVILHE